MGKKRNWGIDFLRLLSMYLVVVYHLLYHGGILAEAPTRAAPQALRILTLCAVDCFGLISGFVGLRQDAPKLAIKRMGHLWLQTVFYSVGGLLLAACIYRPILSRWNLAQALLPIASNQYWYATAYMGLALLIPWLNFLMCRLNRQELGTLAAGLAAVFCLYSTLANPLSDNFRLWGGCHFAWLAVLYVIGGALGRDGWLEKLKTRLAAIAFLLCGGSLWLTNRLGILSDFQLERNCSPLVLAMAICLMTLCTRIRFSVSMQKLLGWMAPAAFGVYLLHDNPNLRQVFIAERFAPLALLPAWKMIGCVLLAAALIFLTGIGVDRVRMLLFSRMEGLLFAKSVE